MIRINSLKIIVSDPVLTKLFKIWIKIRLKFINLLLWTFDKIYYNYITIDCWSLF